jgi:hypothetical protein
MSDPNMFVRYAPMLARRIQAINVAHIRELAVVSPNQAERYSQWHDDISRAIIETLAHMEKAVDYYRQLAIDAMNVSPGPPTITMPAPPEGKEWKLVAVPWPESNERPSTAQDEVVSWKMVSESEEPKP